jgi:hypothetical protein
MNMNLRGHKLCHCAHGGPYEASIKDNLVVDGDDRIHKHLFIRNIFPRSQESLGWLSGGDLLVASGILFALTDVRYMTLSEGTNLRRFEAEKRKTNPGYFYYNKTILSPAQFLGIDYDYERQELDDDDRESGDETLWHLTHDTTDKWWWLWDKAAAGPIPPPPSFSLSNASRSSYTT